MAEFARILVPTDFSALAARALEYALLLARRSGADVTVLHVDTFLAPLDYPEAPATVYLETLPEIKAAAEERLADYIGRHAGPGARVRGRVETNTPIEGIIDAAKREPFDLIVMGTHGRSGWRRALLGSVAEAVLRRVTTPVLTVRESEAAGPPSIRRILCPVNFTATARKALDYASAVSSLLGANLTVLNVHEDDVDVSPEVALHRLRQWLPPQLADCECGELRLGRHPAEEILSFAKSSGADLIVLGAQHRALFDRTVIGTTTEEITRNSRCPVLTVTRETSAEDDDRETEQLARASGLA